MDRSKRRDESGETGLVLMVRKLGLSAVFDWIRALAGSSQTKSGYPALGRNDGKAHSVLKKWRPKYFDHTRLPDQTAAHPTPTLLGIPGELRNKIYRFALLSPSEIEISSSNYTQPSLLRTNHQLRSEATSIFYGENSFTVVVDDCKLEPHLNHWVWAQDPDFHHFGEANWGNLKAWLKLYWGEGEVVPSLGEAKDDADDAPRVYQQAFGVVYEMREAGVGWEVVERVLEGFMRGVDVKSGDWRWQ